MNTTQRRAIDYAISNANDNLYRYERGYEADNKAKTGNDVPFAEIIEKLKKEIADLKEGLV